MHLIATKTIRASVNGTQVKLTKGEPYSGDKKTADYLKGLGFLETKKPERKVKDHER